MFTDRELADLAWSELSKTTDAYPTWVKKGKPNTHWAKAKAALDQIGLSPPEPPPSGVELDAFEIQMEPNNTDPGGAVNASFFWTCWHSPVTPRHAPNGIDPDARYLVKGDHVFLLKGFLWLTSEGCERVLNHHACAVPGVGWESEVSPFALDQHGLKTGPSGGTWELNLEYERVQDTQDSQPHSGGMSVGFPAYLSAPNVWHWLLIELRLGNSLDGIVRVWDWETGAKLVDLSGVNTLKAAQNWQQVWEGGYNSSGVGSRAICRQTPGLFADFTAGPRAVLLDKPVLAGAWGSQANTGAKPSQVLLKVEKAPVPAGVATYG